LNEPLCPPLHLESTYTRPPSGDYFSEEDGGRGWIYSRIANPTRKLLEDTISALELADSVQHPLAVTCAFSSGMAAVSSIILALPQPLHIILPDDIYHGVPTQLKGMFVQRGVTYSTIDMTNIDRIEKAIRSAKVDNILVWMESPSNPGCKVVDIEAVCSLVSSCRNDNIHITTVVDSTWAPPNLTQPLLVRFKNGLLSLS
jgi:cystathionine gamma-synthase